MTKSPHSHTAASTWIKTRRQISTWIWFNLQNEEVKKERKEKEGKSSNVYFIWRHDYGFHTLKRSQTVLTYFSDFFALNSSTKDVIQICTRCGNVRRKLFIIEHIPGSLTTWMIQKHKMEKANKKKKVTRNAWGNHASYNMLDWMYEFNSYHTKESNTSITREGQISSKIKPLIAR